ncbi:MAG: nickel pincer cofactor biosynthesis protein LarB [Atopobiaceae bacterium]|jgi:NCAIR mutase (PurE)-related protein
MQRDALRALLAQVADGSVDVERALAEISAPEYVDLGYAKPDLSRSARQGVAEVIYGEGKTGDQIIEIAHALVDGGEKHVLVTRISKDKAASLEASFADDGIAVDYDSIPRVACVGGKPKPQGRGYIAVCCAGTSDLYCAEEAALTAEMLGSRVERLYDVGVAGLHRLLNHADVIQQARVVVAIAGMEGALASVIGGLAACPVIACPTSVGYGASFGGVAALLAMLNSCASGVSVVNIDNGFGAGYQAALIDRLGRSAQAGDKPLV